MIVTYELLNIGIEITLKNGILISLNILIDMIIRKEGSILKIIIY